MTTSPTLPVYEITGAGARKVLHLAGCTHLTRARNAGKPVTDLGQQPAVDILGGYDTDPATGLHHPRVASPTRVAGCLHERAWTAAWAHLNG